MTDSLRTYTRKRLAAMARRRHVRGWHEMRKAELIKALEAQASEEHRSTFPKTFPVLNGESGNDERNFTSTTSPNGNGRSHSRLRARPLLRSVDRSSDRLSATAQSPYWIRTEWALSHTTLRQVEAALGVARHGAVPVLRLFDVSSDERLTHAVTLVSDTTIPGDSQEWFVQVDQPGGAYLVQLGIRTRAGQFHRLISSARVDTGTPLSSPVSAVALQPSPESICCNGHHSSARTTTIPLCVEAELVIRGATHPQAVMAVDRESIPIDTDGSFRHARRLTDGRHVIPTTALSPDGRRQHTIVLAVECNTKHLAPRGPDDE